MCFSRIRRDCISWRINSCSILGISFNNECVYLKISKDPERKFMTKLLTNISSTWRFRLMLNLKKILLITMRFILRMIMEAHRLSSEEISDIQDELLAHLNLSQASCLQLLEMMNFFFLILCISQVSSILRGENKVSKRLVTTEMKVDGLFWKPSKTGFQKYVHHF